MKRINKPIGDYAFVNNYINLLEINKPSIRRYIPTICIDTDLLQIRVTNKELRLLFIEKLNKIKYTSNNYFKLDSYSDIIKITKGKLDEN